MLTSQLKQEQMMKSELAMLTTIKVICNWKILLLLEEKTGLCTRLNLFRSWKISKQRLVKKSRTPLPMKSVLLLPLLTTRTPSSMRLLFSRKNLLSKRNFSQHFKANSKLINRTQMLALQSLHRKLLRSLKWNRTLLTNRQITHQKELSLKKKSVFSMKSSTDTKMVFGTTTTSSKRELTITLTINISIMNPTMREKYLRSIS